MSNSTPRKRVRKASATKPRKRKSKASATRPKKPYKDFPLYAHGSGKWAKKICGQLHYFGRWGSVVRGSMERLPGDGWREALELYRAQADDLHAGRDPVVVEQGAPTIAGVCNDFLNYKLGLLETGEITRRTFDEYRSTTDRLVRFFGGKRKVDSLRNVDFEQLRVDIAKQYGPVRLGNEVVRVRGVFRYARKADLIPETFKKPSAKVLRVHRAKGGKKLYTAEEVLQQSSSRLSCAA